MNRKSKAEKEAEFIAALDSEIKRVGQEPASKSGSRKLDALLALRAEYQSALMGS